MVNAIAGHEGLVDANENRINLRGGMVNYLASVYGARLFDDDTREHIPIMGTSNTLNVYVKNADINELTDCNNYNFYIHINIQTMVKTIFEEYSIAPLLLFCHLLINWNIVLLISKFYSSIRII